MPQSGQEIRCGDFRTLRYVIKRTGHCGRVERDAKSLPVSCRQRGGVELLEEHRNDQFSRSRVRSCRAQDDDSPTSLRYKAIIRYPVMGSNRGR
jgi:hypothetical protein